MKTETHDIVAELKDRWVALQQEQPKIRIRDAAQKLGVSEAQLLATSCGTGKATRLGGSFGAIIEAVPGLGKVMALTRNEEAVHERKGRYESVQIKGTMGLVLGEAIDLRLFLGEWTSGFAVREEVEGGTRRSLHFFDQYGIAVHKIYLQEEELAGAFDALIYRFADGNQSAVLTISQRDAQASPKADEEIDLNAFRKTWDELKDTHQFFSLLKKFGLDRTQALRLAGVERARPLANSTLRDLLQAASQADLPIMIFVGNRGGIQIHTGPVRKIKVMGPWINVLDPDFNLHLREDLIRSTWLVRKPTVDGIVTSLELYNETGENIALIFGKRKPGQEESPDWRGLIENLSERIASGNLSASLEKVG